MTAPNQPPIRTATVMLYTDGTRSGFAVMRGPMKSPRVFDAHRADIVATYEILDGSEPDYAAMTAEHATTWAPAVEWQRPTNVDSAIRALNAIGSAVR